MVELLSVSSNNKFISDSDSANNVRQVLNLDQVHSHDPKLKFNYKPTGITLLKTIYRENPRNLI